MSSQQEATQSVTVSAAATVVQVIDEKAMPIVVSALENEPAASPRGLADWPNFVVVEQGTRSVEVTELTQQVVANVRGVQGPPGPVGPAGPTGPQGPIGSLESGLDGLNDVLLVNLQDGQILRYSQPLAQWTNSNQLDGGNF